MTPRAGSQPPTEARRLKLFGTPIRFHITFLIFFVVLLVLSAQSPRGLMYQGLYFVGIFASVLLHELAHALMARRFGIKTTEIIMFPIGGVALLERQPAPKEELLIALAGPAINLVLAAVYLAFSSFQLSSLSLFLSRNAFQEDNLLLVLGQANLVLALFNLLPAFPMDGGRALRALLALFYPEADATRFAARAGIWLAFALGVYGLVNGNYWLVFICMFVFLGASQEALANKSRVLSSGFPVSSAMVTEFRALQHGDSMREAGRQLLATSQHHFPVMLGDRVLGLLDRMSLIRGLAEDPDAYVSNYMLRDFPVLQPEQDLVEVLPMFTSTEMCALVMREDQLLGMLTGENLGEFLQLRRLGLEPRDGRIEIAPERE